MATASQVKAGLDDISQAIRTERNALLSVKARITTAKTNLNSLPVAYADAIATINAYVGGGEDDFEKQAVADLAVLTVEFQALKAKATTAETDLAAIDFTT